MVQLQSVMLRLRDTLHDFRSVTMVCSRGSLGANLSSPQKNCGKNCVCTEARTKTKEK